MPSVNMACVLFDQKFTFNPLKIIRQFSNHSFALPSIIQQLTNDEHHITPKNGIALHLRFPIGQNFARLWKRTPLFVSGVLGHLVPRWGSRGWMRFWGYNLVDWVPLIDILKESPWSFEFVINIFLKIFAEAVLVSYPLPPLHASGPRDGPHLEFASPTTDDRRWTMKWLTIFYCCYTISRHSDTSIPHSTHGWYSTVVCCCITRHHHHRTLTLLEHSMT